MKTVTTVEMIQDRSIMEENLQRKILDINNIVIHVKIIDYNIITTSE